MKKAIFLGLFLTLAVPFTSFAAFDSNLKYGSSGSAVKEMQEFLVDQGVCDITPTGNFFALTLKCVKAFQTKQGISPVSGYWGPLSRAEAVGMLALNDSDKDELATTGTINPPTAVSDVTYVNPTPVVSPVISPVLPVEVPIVVMPPEKPIVFVDDTPYVYLTLDSKSLPDISPYPLNQKIASFVLNSSVKHSIIGQIEIKFSGTFDLTKLRDVSVNKIGGTYLTTEAPVQIVSADKVILNTYIDVSPNRSSGFEIWGNIGDGIGTIETKITKIYGRDLSANGGNFVTDTSSTPSAVINVMAK